MNATRQVNARRRHRRKPLLRVSSDTVLNYLLVVQEAPNDQGGEECPKRKVGVYDGDRRPREREADMSGLLPSFCRHPDL